ncbi:hypothetical protein [Scytonema sp. NUACC21]
MHPYIRNLLALFLALCTAANMTESPSGAVIEPSEDSDRHPLTITIQ